MSLRALQVVACLLLTACLRLAHAGEPQRPAVSADRPVNDLFGALRRRVAAPDRAYWRRVGNALSRLKHLEAAAYDEDSGAILLIGTPADERGPYHLDDLVTALRATLFERQALGMTIDPDPRNPLGPKMVVRYFGGCQDTAFGWVMFECDRLLKCYTQGRDNFTHEPVLPQVPGFATMLQRYAAANGKSDVWSRFWLTPDLEGKAADGPPPKKSNGYQPIVRVTDDGQTMRLVHCRLYLRTETMQLVDGVLQPATGTKDVQAEQFAAHFNANYQEFVNRQPELARLQALSELAVLADWIEQLHIPLDIGFLQSYVPQVAVETPMETPAGTAEMMQAAGGGAVRRWQIYGGVDLTSQLFLAVDDGSAAQLGQRARSSQREHRDQVDWQIDSTSEPREVLVVPTMLTELNIASTGAVTHVQFRRPKDEKEADGQRLPEKSVRIAQSERRRDVPRVQLSLAALDLLRAQRETQSSNSARPSVPADESNPGPNSPRAPPDNVIQGELPRRSELAKSDRRQPEVRRERVRLDGPVALLTDARHLAESERETLVKAERVVLSAMPGVMAQRPRPPPDSREGGKAGTALSPGRSSLGGDETDAGPTDRGREELPLNELNPGPNVPRPPPGNDVVATDSIAGSSDGGRNESLAKSDRREPQVRREAVSLDRPPKPASVRSDGEGSSLFQVSSERASRVGRESVPLFGPAGHDASTSLPVFASATSGPTFNFPQLVTRASLRHERTAGVQGIPGTEVKVPDQLSLVSELGDMVVAFGEPVIDQARAEVYFPPLAPASGLVRGYYPRSQTLELMDGMQVRFDAHGRPVRAERADGAKIDFHYAAEGDDLALASCTVESAGNSDESGDYQLTRFEAPRREPPPAARIELPKEAHVAPSVTSPGVASGTPSVAPTQPTRPLNVRNDPAPVQAADANETGVLLFGLAAIAVVAAWMVLRR